MEGLGEIRNVEKKRKIHKEHTKKRVMTHRNRERGGGGREQKRK